MAKQRGCEVDVSDESSEGRYGLVGGGERKG